SVKAGIEAWQKADYARAVAIWRPLAENGDADAAFNLGQAYRLGRGVKIDLGEAQSWLERAASQGHVDAQTTLGLLLFGNGNQAEGARWLKQAAEKGEARAMLIYGTALFNGDGVPQDRVLGYAYVSRASAQGLGPAKATLDQMDEVMPLADRKKGLAIAMQKAKSQAKAPARTSRTQTAKTAAKSPSSKPTVTANGGGWAVQLGAFSKRSSAEALYRKLSSTPALAGKGPRYVAAGAVTRLQVAGFQSRSAASAACAALTKRGQPCFITQVR
ncbi:MAG TPA: SPOR domain-containing protein, partial [Sphingomicrobium sp.]|nr:SPOR domain-containing protein [Sphingomicrobium sp.]